ncbi:NAD(P)-binding protein [Pseudovirgaria hyperparasitica]|uniref:NAD(P)-binding protein n=1 Tax=Pseudovirgaria hyperparasitica TaxID=470096 RepID=A0A6A6W7G4_9PEZI|nr:NAD(P)-binding protein [Pseudovirgaria hyperparasitica]KAF2758802.1 NAD(P)-binding protein [Pseudovirgaria hyperparasitica]
MANIVPNKGLIFKSAPSGWPIPGKDLAIEARDFDLNQAPPTGGVTTKNHYFSFDPYQRGRMRAPEVKSYSPPYTLGQPITNRGILRVLKSDNDRFKPGDLITSQDATPIEEYSALSADILRRARVLTNPYGLDPKIYLGALGMPGLTAWSSFYEIGEPNRRKLAGEQKKKAGKDVTDDDLRPDTIFVSAASGAVGQLVGQLAKHNGMRVVGSVGDDKKLDFILKDLKFDAGFNYKKLSGKSVTETLKELAPEGIDIYYENVGGEQLEAAISNMNEFGRIIACGMVSQYNLTPDQLYGVKNLMNIVGKRIKFQGFIVGDLTEKWSQNHQETLSEWLSKGEMKAQMSLTHGIDNAVEGFLGMLKGENFGKAVLVVNDEV